MNPTDKVLGSISAINTFLENFPMSILDMMHGKTYTSIFDFMVDVLAACGVNVNEIINQLLREIYGIEETVTDGIEGLYAKIRSGEIRINDQNEFMEALENSIKVIFMGLLSSIFTCSALPVLPNRVFDGPKRKYFEKRGGDGNGIKDSTLNALSDPKTPFDPLLIPKGIIDPMGILDINPTSDDGRLFYAVEGGDKYYVKTYELQTIYETKEFVSTTDGEIVVSEVSDAPKYNTFVAVYFKITEQGNSNNSSFKEDKYAVFADVYKIDENTNTITKTTDGVPYAISVSLTYTPYGGKGTQVWNATIKKGETRSQEELLLSTEKKNKKSILNWASINAVNGEGEIGDKTWAYLCKESSDNFVKRWNNNGVHSLPWGSKNEETEQIVLLKTTNVTAGGVYEDAEPKTEYIYSYQELNGDELYEVDFNNFQRVNYLPTEGIDASSPEYIVCYGGLNPNLLYKTFDMNAFLWYVLHKGMKNPQIEYNHMMWDSRISAAKQGIGRKSAEEWNNWYNSKTDYVDEFKYFDSDIVKETPLFPIIQLEPQGTAENLLRIRIPAQRYFYPNVRTANIYGYEPPKHAFNASMYRYNWEYLNNIKILQPKILLTGLLDTLLGFSISTIKSADINFTKKIIEAKLSSAIKSIIESNDMEVEDCYMTFSNDEVNTMLEEMLLSRYSGTMYGGETTTVRVHDTNKYIAMLDQVNSSANMNGNVTAISKLVTEVTASPGTEGSIDYGLSVSTDGNLLKKLLWAIVMPILMSIFTPQVLLILYMNLVLMGLTKIDDAFNQDFTKIINLLMNKIFGLMKSIIIFIKDKIVELLLTYLYEKLLPLLIKYELILLLERIEYWLTILKAALACLPKFKFKFNKVIGSIDSVDYADIVSTQDTPESTSTC